MILQGYTDEQRKRIDRSADGAAVALLAETWDNGIHKVVGRTGVYCLDCDDWSELAWDGRQLGPRCCLEVT